MSSGEVRRYTGYLSEHIDRIKQMHAAGCDNRAIAEKLYELGERAATTDVYSRKKMKREHHIKNLRTMTTYALTRLGLHVPRKRVPRWPDHDQV